MEIDPLSLVNAADLGWVYYVKRDYKMAQQHVQKAIDLDENFEGAHNYMISILSIQKKYAAAIEEGKKAAALGGNNPIDLAFLASVYPAAGNQEEAKKILQDLNTRASNDYVSPYFTALIHHALGDRERAIALMQQACEQRDVVWNMLYLHVDPAFDDIRNDAAFRKLLECMNLPRSQQRLQSLLQTKERSTSKRCKRGSDKTDGNG